MWDWIERGRRLTEGEVCTHGSPTPGFESSSQGVKMRLVLVLVITMESALTWRYEAGRGRA